MEERIIKAGWVHKRSAYLKQWRRRWLVLSETSLSTYKSKDISQRATMQLLVSSITEAVPSVLEVEKDFCFKIVCEDEFFMTVESDKDLCLWLNLINHVRLGRNISIFDSPNFSRESKALSDESLITSFSQIKGIINQREADILSQLEITYDDYKIRAEEEHKILAESLGKEIENCKIITESLSSDASVLSKIQQIQRLTKDRHNFKPFDNINEAKLKISLDQSTVSKITRPNIKIALKSPSEYFVRRTAITRALK
jgi:PH domain.